MRDKYDRIMNFAFNNDKSFQNALKSSFEYIINLNPRSREFLSLFYDKLWKGPKECEPGKQDPGSNSFI